MARNPFIIGEIVQGKHFCPRPELVKILRQNIDAAINTVIMGPRRIGKSSLVFEATRLEKNHKLLYIDLWGLNNREQLTTAIYREYLNFLSTQGSSIKDILKRFAYLRPVVELDENTGKPKFSVEIKEDQRTPTTITEALELLGKSGEKHKLVVCFDEFQQLLTFPESENLMALMRSTIQRLRTPAFVFTGSIRRSMHEIFLSLKNPFFKSAEIIEVAPLKKNDFYKFTQKKFQEDNRNFPKETATAILEISNGITEDAFQLCSSIWNITEAGETITEETSRTALLRILAQEDSTNRHLFNLLKSTQKKVLYGLARSGGNAPTSKEFLKSSNIPQPSSVSTALKRLTQLDLIYHHDGEYKFFSPFFRYWLLEKSNFQV
ncbi:MAG: ATP-binding protein [Verrucomicrobia bacterium]|nr:ATP-binding protein [Verrucomicrobiota bacterium]